MLLAHYTVAALCTTSTNSTPVGTQIPSSITYYMCETNAIQRNHSSRVFALQVLRLSQTKVSTLTSGKIVNLVAGDSQRYEETALKLLHVVLSSFEFCVVIFLTWYLLGCQALGGALFMAILVLYYASMSRLCAKLRSRIARVTDRRLNRMNSIVRASGR